jgi:signal peptidase II
MMLARNRKIFVFILVFLISIAVDVVTKALVSALMEPGSSITLIPRVLSITYTKNSGAAFGLFAGSGQIVFWSALVIVVLMLIWFFSSQQQKNVWTFIALGLMIGGAVGNLIDRIFMGKVVDFIDVGWWPVFNVADIEIVAGVIILIVVMILEMTARTAEEDSQTTGD